MDRETERKLAKLQALEDAGVDNWESYDYALVEWRKENAIEEIIDEAVLEINELTVEAEVDFPAGMDAGHSITFPEGSLEDVVRKVVIKIKNYQ
jgi:hypothetical protein